MALLTDAAIERILKFDVNDLHSASDYGHLAVDAKLVAKQLINEIHMQPRKETSEPTATVHPVVTDLLGIRGSKVDRLFGTSSWAGTFDGMPALTLSFNGGATLNWFEDGCWWSSQSFPSIRDLHERLGIIK